MKEIYLVTKAPCVNNILAAFTSESEANDYAAHYEKVKLINMLYVDNMVINPEWPEDYEG